MATANPFGSTTEDPEISPPQPPKKRITRAQAKKRAAVFYKKHNPDKLEVLDRILDKYEDNYESLLVELEHKYCSDPDGDVVPSVVEKLKKCYKEKIRPLEELYKFEDFDMGSLSDSDFDAKPMVLLLGQYSTGKTTFIRYLLEREFPGQRIGPEPTTDRFVSIMHGDEDRVIPGNALVMDSSKPFRALARHGMAFLNKFECSQLDVPILEKLMFVDTPGVLSGEKQRLGRSYDFTKVVAWFASRADRILLLFDAHKLDISDEFKRTIEVLRGHDDKIRVVLNKADMIDGQQLMRVYGALMWSLGKVIRTPEVLRVYIGSFWDKELQNKDSAKLFAAEKADLFADLRSLPRNSAMRKINELVKRTRTSQVHAYIVSHLKAEMPMFGKDKKKRQLIEGLADVFYKIHLDYGLSIGDFPDRAKYQQLLEKYDFKDFPKFNKKLMDRCKEALEIDIPRIMKGIPSYTDDSATAKSGESSNPFEQGPLMAAAGWMISAADKSRYDTDFDRLEKSGGKIRGDIARQVMSKSGVDWEVLKKIWVLGDIDGDGALDADEYAVVMYLIEQAKTGADTPAVLPADLVPPSKRQMNVLERESGTGM